MTTAADATTPTPPIVLGRRRRAQRGLVVGHTGVSVAKYHSTFAFGAVVPLLAGAAVFGWRATAAVGVVLASVVAAVVVWRKVGLRGATLRPAQVLSWALLLALMLPAELLSKFTLTRAAEWPVLPAAGVGLVVLCWGVAGRWGGRAHPAVVAYLLLAAAVGPGRLAGHYVLQRNRVAFGDVLDARGERPRRAVPDGWLRRPISPGGGAVAAESVPAALDEFTHGRPGPDGRPRTMVELLRDAVPPLDDLILGATPGGIGTSGAIAAIVGGLFLLYRGMIDPRVPVGVVAAAWLVLLVLPVPVDGHWTWAASHAAGVGWGAGVTFANYEVMGTPLVFTAVFLAASPAVRPIGRKGRVRFAVLLGIVAAVSQVYVSAGMGSYLALLVVGLVAPAFDRNLGGRPLA